MDFTAYLRDFNELSRAELVKRYFTPDCVVHLPSFIAPPDGTVRGEQDWLAMLMADGDTIKEVGVLVALAQDDHLVMAEFDIEYVSQYDEPDFVLAPLRADIPTTFRFFGAYHLRDGKVARLDLAWWPNPVTGAAEIG